MLATHSPLYLRAADLMSPDVLALPAEMSLQGAARLLYRLQISGAPVVDDQGRCVGVLSTTDFMHCVERDGGPVKVVHAGTPVICPWEIPEAETISDAHQVQDFMSRNPVTVAADTPLAELARVLLEAHIHRLVVVDQREHPIGIVSTSNILAALARAAGIGLDRHTAEQPVLAHA